MSLQIKDLSFHVAGRTLLKDINLKLNGNVITIVMGPNGSGKSLLLRMMHGLLKPTGGQVLWDGKVVDRPQSHAQAMVFQRPVLLRRSVMANMLFALKLRNSTNKGLANDLLQRVGLSSQAKQPARLLSGGEQQRLALARALALKPNILLLDEPTANLDPASTGVIEDIVRQVAEAGCKAIFVTHDVGQAKRLADDIVFMANGEIKEHQDATLFFSQPGSKAAYDYLAGKLVL